MDEVSFKSKMTLYGITTKNGSVYFKNIDQLNNYLRTNHIIVAFKTKVEYMGNILNCIDVIKQTYEDGSYRYVSAMNDEGYMIYSFEQSKKENKPIWGYIPGDLREMYDAFKSNGIKLEDDTYGKIDNQHKTKRYIKRQLA